MFHVERHSRNTLIMIMLMMMMMTTTTMMMMIIGNFHLSMAARTSV